MKRSTLTPVQAYKVISALQPSFGYLNELRTQLEDRGVLTDDKLFGRVETALDAMQNLLDELHHLNHERHGGSFPME